MQTDAEQFNARFPVGTRVRCQPVKGDPKTIDTRTRSEAWMLGCGVAVVKIHGRSGGVALDHLTDTTTSQLLRGH